MYQSLKNNNSDYVKNMFSIPIAHFKVRDWNAKKSKLLNVVDHSKVVYGCGNEIQTDFHSLTERTGYEVAVQSILSEELEMFCNSFQFSRYSFEGAWFEKASQNDYHGVHNHGPFGYSSVCFVEYDEDEHEPTTFIAPFNHFISGLPLMYRPKVQEGSIIFFPSSILHYTTPNISLKERKILSFNVLVE